jgi:hypothetical protein
MNRITKINAFLLLFCSFALAQNNTNAKLDFNGTWVIDEEKSFSLKEMREGYKNYILEISDDGTIFKINKSRLFHGQPVNFKVILFTDERGESNTFSIGNKSAEVKSKTGRKKGSVIRQYKYEIEGKNGKSKHSGNEKYTLSKDGKILTLTIAASSEIPIPPFSGRVNARSLNKLIFYKKD